MRKIRFFIPLLLLLIVFSSFSQGYNIEKEITFSADSDYGYNNLQIPFNRQRFIIAGTAYALGSINGVNTTNYYDMENDGIPEILNVNYGGNKTKIEIYDGSSFSLKNTVLIDSFLVEGDEQGNFVGFLDVDGDNTKEIVGEFKYFPNPPPYNQYFNQILFIDIQNGLIEYAIPHYHPTYSPDGYEGYAIYDIDNDSYPEVICRWHTEDGSKKIRVYGSSPSEISKQKKPLAKAHSANLKNYPNPFFNSTRIEYYVSSAEKVTLKIFNSEGKLLRLLVNKQQPIGEYTIIWDGKNDNKIKMAPGQYYYQIKIGEFISTKRMISLN